MFGALTQGVNFKCNATICFGIGPVHEQFKTLQQTINRFAPLGIPLLVVDGFIGDATVVAANLAAEVSGGTPPGKTREAVAANALTLTAQLQNSVAQLESEGILTSTTSSAAPETPPITSAVDRAAQTAPAPEIKAAVQQIIAACRASGNSPACERAKTMCQSVRGTPEAKLPEIAQICAAARSRTWIWLLVGGGFVAAGTVGLLLHRRRHAEPVALARPRRRRLKR